MGRTILMYRGHGVYWSAMPSPNVGGFALSKTFVSNDMIRNDLHLAPNAIVMLYGCFTSGSSGNDTTSITSTEAQRRVAMYSDPFFDIGVGGYYADWFGDAFQKYVQYLFEGKTLKETYNNSTIFNAASVERYTHPNHPDKVMWLDKDNWYDPKPQYNDAFAGIADATLTDLFQPPAPPTMGVSPLSITRIVQSGENPMPVSIAVTITSPDPATLLTWYTSISQPAAWLTTAPTLGTSGQNIALTLPPRRRHISGNHHRYCG